MPRPIDIQPSNSNQPITGNEPAPKKGGCGGTCGGACGTGDKSRSCCKKKCFFLAIAILLFGIAGFFIGKNF